MKNCLKKTSFVVAGLAMIGSSLIFGSPNSVIAAVKEGQKFSDWVVSCAKDDKKNQICFLSQQVTSTKDDKSQVLAMYQIGYFGQGKEKGLKIVEILPANITITPGTSIISSEQLIAPGKFVTCTQGSCQAVAPISDKDLKTILSSANNAIGVMNAEGKQINFPLSTKGLDEGLKALK